jgi:hypothetical protein
MNFAKMIEEQLSGNTLDKLSSVLGADPDTTSRAASAAVPTILAALANLASNDDGLRKLTGALNNVDSSGVSGLGQLLSGDTGGLLNKGMSLLSSLFGENMLTSISSAIGRYSGLDSGIVRKLIAMLAPAVLGKVASQWKAQGGTPSALAGLMAEQKRYLPDAMPAGFSMEDVPGLAGAQEAYRAVGQVPRRTAESAERAAPSLASWLLPIAGLLLVGILLWQFMKPRPEAGPTAQQTGAQQPTQSERVTAMKPAVPDTPSLPSVAQLTDELNTTFSSIGETFASIKDAASAEAAAPKLEELSRKVDSIKAMMARLPETGRTTLQTVVQDQLTPVKEQAQQALDLPGLSERIRTLINQIVRKLEEWHIIQPAG